MEGKPRQPASDLVEKRSRPPRNVGEALRVAHALMFNCEDWTTGFLVMSTRYPMYWVKGVAADLDAAEGLLAAPGPSNPYVASAVDDKIEIIELHPTGRMRMSPMVDVCYHDCFTEWVCPLESKVDIKAADVAGYEVHVKLRDGRTVKVENIPRTADLISMRQSAMERFIYPQYESSLGRRYTDRLRARWRHSEIKDFDPQV